MAIACEAERVIVGKILNTYECETFPRGQTYSTNICREAWLGVRSCYFTEVEEKRGKH